MVVGIGMALISLVVVSAGIVLVRRPDLRERTRDQPPGFRRPTAIEATLLPYGLIIVGSVVLVAGIVTAVGGGGA